MALHWAEWVAATPSQRRTFYKDTIWDPERRRAIDIEMGKIKTFNYVHNQNHVEHLVGKKFQDIQVKTMIKNNHLIRKVPDQGLIKSSFLVTLIVNNVQYRVSNVQFSVDSNQDATENDSTEPGSGQGDRETIIRRVLEQTSEAICEIDGLLTTLKCSS